MVNITPESIKGYTTLDDGPIEGGRKPQEMVLSKLQTYVERFNSDYKPSLDSEGDYLLDDDMVIISSVESVEQLKAVGIDVSVKVQDFMGENDAVIEMTALGQNYLIERDSYVIFEGNFIPSMSSYVVKMPESSFDQSIAFEALAYAESLHGLLNRKNDKPLVLDTLLETFKVEDLDHLKLLFHQIGLGLFKVNPRYSTETDPSGDTKTEFDSLVRLIKQDRVYSDLDTGM